MEFRGSDDDHFSTSIDFHGLLMKRYFSLEREIAWMRKANLIANLTSFDYLARLASYNLMRAYACMHTTYISCAASTFRRAAVALVQQDFRCDVFLGRSHAQHIGPTNPVRIRARMALENSKYRQQKP